MSRDAVSARPDVTPSILAKLDTFVLLLAKWQAAINLVAPSTLAVVWERHVLDSLQLVPFLDRADGTLIDLGSGAGFPGLVLAMARPEMSVHLVESDGRKAEFLRHVSRETSTAVRVWQQRIDEVAATGIKGEYVTARALAPLGELLKLSEPFCHTETIRLFPKGRAYASELTVPNLPNTLQIAVLPSVTSATAAIIRVEGVRLA